MRRLQDVSVACRLWAWAALLRPLKHVVSLDALVRLAHVAPRTGRPRSLDYEQSLERYMSSTDRFPLRAPGNCLERSLGAYRLLCAAHANPTLVVGLKRSPSHGVQGHVWVLVDGRAVAERRESVATYTAVVTFDAQARQSSVSGAAGALAGIRFA